LSFTLKRFRSIVTAVRRVNTQGFRGAHCSPGCRQIKPSNSDPMLAAIAGSS
jgi:hypothetical protein